MRGIAGDGVTEVTIVSVTVQISEDRVKENQAVRELSTSDSVSREPNCGTW